jgi:methylglutaconyl-CoA hydratase
MAGSIDGPIKRAGDEVVTLCLDVPGTRNALSIAVLEELLERLDEVARDDRARLVVLTATGNVFSSGANLDELRDPACFSRLSELVSRVVRRISELTKPVVCQVNGDAYGAAVAILAVSDVVVAARTARFSVAEVRFGMVPTVAAACLVRKVGLTAALDLMLTGRRFGAVEAGRVGFVSEVVETDELGRVVQGRVADLLLGNPAAIGITKQLAWALAGPPLAKILEVAEAYGGLNLTWNTGS